MLVVVNKISPATRLLGNISNWNVDTAGLVVISNKTTELGVDVKFTDIKVVSLTAPKPADKVCGIEIIRLKVAENGDNVIFHSLTTEFPPPNHNLFVVWAISPAVWEPGTFKGIVVLVNVS